MNVKIKRLNNNAIIPTKAHSTDAGFDLYACIESSIVIHPQETVKIPTGWAWEIPENFFGGIYARSGLATKEGLRPANCVGVVDSSYRGEVTVAIYNDSDGYVRIIQPNQKIAQLIVQPYLMCMLEESDELSSTERGENGFGSSGK